MQYRPAEFAVGGNQEGDSQDNKADTKFEKKEHSGEFAGRENEVGQGHVGNNA